MIACPLYDKISDCLPLFYMSFLLNGGLHSVSTQTPQLSSAIYQRIIIARWVRLVHSIRGFMNRLCEIRYYIISISGRSSPEREV